jgi:hypothetical protein
LKLFRSLYSREGLRGRLVRSYKGGCLWILGGMSWLFNLVLRKGGV